MSRYIDAGMIKYTEDIPDIFIASKTQIDNIPTADVVEVVRCKDCVYRRLKFDPIAEPAKWYGCDVMMFNEDEWYCSFGEKKDDTVEKLTEKIINEFSKEE